MYNSIYEDSRLTQKAAHGRFLAVHVILLTVLGIYLGASTAEARAIKLTQNFQPGSAEAFERALTYDIDTVILDVTGGYLSEGLKIGRIIRARKLKTVVPADAHCLSACAEVFLGGVGQRIEGVVAFHVPRVDRLGSRLEAFGLGLAGGTLTAIYRHEMGYGFELTKEIMRWTSANRLLAFEDIRQLNSYRKRSVATALPILIVADPRTFTT